MNQNIRKTWFGTVILKVVIPIENNEFERYFARKVDRFVQDAITLLDIDVKNGTADIFLLTDNVYAISNIGKTYNWFADSWDNPAPEQIPQWYTDKEIWRESDKKMPRGYKLDVGTSDILAEKKLYELKPVAEVAFNIKVKIENPQHLNNALKFAAQLPEESQSSLGWSFQSLKNLIENAKDGNILHIVPDFVPHSFYFYVLKDEEKKVFDGGVILHGFSETFAVELAAPKYPHWSVHT